MGTAVDPVDFDLVEVSNRNRQFFTNKDRGKPKPHALLDNIAPYATRAMTLSSFWMPIDEFACHRPAECYDIYSVGVDNDEANLTSARLALKERKTAVFINVSRDGEGCRLFIQRPGEACFACYKPSTTVL